jgi:hypothetical protein
MRCGKDSTVPAADDFLDQLASLRFSERLFAHLPDEVFCIKEREPTCHHV